MLLKNTVIQKLFGQVLKLYNFEKTGKIMKYKKRILILNGSHSDIPLIKAAKELGFYVITTGNNGNLIGHKYSDEYHHADFSNKEEVLTLAQKLKIDAVCSCANDFGAITASYIAEKMNLPGHDSYETTLKFHHKDSFKDFAIKNDISTPYAKSYINMKKALDDINHFNFPLIIKPVDMTGGKGISKVITDKEYKKAVEKAFSTSKTKRIVIEEFIDGSLHSFSSFIMNGKVAFYFSDNEFSYLNPYMVSTSAAPAIDIDKVKDILIQNSEKIISLLSLKDGLFHIQYILKENKPYIIEITRRCSGDFYPYPVNYSTKLNWASWIVKSESGMDFSNFPKIEQKEFCGRHCIMSPKNGVIKNIHIDSTIKDNIYDKFILMNKGDIIDNFMIQKLGVYFLRYDSMDEMLSKTNIITDLIYVELE